MRSSSYYLLSMGIANADQTRLKEDLSKVQQSEWSDQQKADYITDLLREYSDEYELPYLSVMNRPEIRELLEQNEGVAQQVLAELGRLQIEKDIAQRMEASSALSLAEHQANWMVIDGKCYTYVMPYYGEIPGYTYMAVRRGPDPVAPDGYLYTVDYIPSSEASRYEFNNGLIVTYEVFSTFYNLVYFSVYLPYLQEQYGQGQAAKTTPKPGDPDFMGSTEGQGKSQLQMIRDGELEITFDTRTLRRMGEDTGPYHNVPVNITKELLKNEPGLVRTDGILEFVQKGYVNGVEGVFHASYKDGVITHQFFNPQSDWGRFSQKWELPSWDSIN